MFQYNRFWHFWFQLNNRHYLRVSLVSLAISILLIQATAFFPPLWGLVVALPLLAAGTIALFTQLSNFFYNQQNQRLVQLKTENNGKNLSNEIDLYLNRRVVCSQELLAGSHLNLSHDNKKMEKAVANPPLIFETEDTLNLETLFHATRNPAIKATSQANQLYIKTVAARDGLSEVAAREMAEIIGFEGLIPSNTIAGTDVLHNQFLSMPNTRLVPSREKIKQLIDERKKESPEVQNAIAKFIFNLKNAVYRTKAQKDEGLKLLHIQKFMPKANDGQTLYAQICSPSQHAEAKNTLQKISLPSFQENFLLHLILGSQDANLQNTLFEYDDHNDVVVLHSIDHERIMPEDNYNITKKIPMINGKNPAVEKDIKNVFPIRLWLAGLPQANAPFTREIIEKTLASLNPERLLAYHRQKNLFSPAAVGAQLDRILLIKNMFKEEIKKSQMTLTPKELFLKFINNHPTYLFLKNELQLSDLHLFSIFGQVPEGADMDLLRHPLQWFPMLGMALELLNNQRVGKNEFSPKSFETSHAHHFIFFSMANSQKMSDTANKAGVDILADMSNQLSLH